MSLGTYTSHRIDQEFIAAAEKSGWPEVPDAQDLDSVNAFSKMRRYISPEGKRQDAATCYLRPRLNVEKYPNLHILVETQVTRILIDEETKRVVGVEFRANPSFHPDASVQPSRTVKAKRLVIASSGTCGTPSLLERSGLGDSEILRRAGVPVVVDLPGIGRGYEDHHLVRSPQNLHSPVKFLGIILSSPILDSQCYDTSSSVSRAAFASLTALPQ